MFRKSVMVSSLFLILFLGSAYVADSQAGIWSYLREINLDLSSESREVILEANRQRQYAENLISISLEAGRREGIEDGFAELFKASGAVKNLLGEYIQDIRKGFPDPLPGEMHRPAGFENDAYRYFDMVRQLMEEAGEIEDDEKAVSVLYMAWDLEMVAILYKARALLMYMDFPVVYKYPWDNDVAILTDEPREAADTIEVGRHEGTESDILSEEAALENGIYYIIQIAAHTEELGQRQLTSIYAGEKEINVMFEDGWYKYYIGPYRSYEEADSTMNSLNLGSAFIAAYHDGQRIGVNEARRRQSQR